MAEPTVSANERIGVAFVGAGGHGGNNILPRLAAMKDIRVTHVCDVDESHRERRGAELEKRAGYRAKLINDHRAILDDPNVDAVVIATPDHWHALITLHACQAGKDVYVEKPDAHNIAEGQAMVAAARRYERIVQLGLKQAFLDRG